MVKLEVHIALSKYDVGISTFELYSSSISLRACVSKVRRTFHGNQYVLHQLLIFNIHDFGFYIYSRRMINGGMNGDRLFTEILFVEFDWDILAEFFVGL